MKKLARIILAAVVLLATTLVHAAEVTVFAAASLTDSLKEIATTYEKQSDAKIVFNFGASSTLARQIEEGAPADIFFSADEAKMDGLEQKGLILKQTRKSRLSNSLVIVVAAEQGAAIERPCLRESTRRNIFKNKTFGLPWKAKSSRLKMSVPRSQRWKPAM